MKPNSVILLVENDKDYLFVLEQIFRKADIRNPLRIARYGNEAILYLRGVGIYSDRRNYPLPGLMILDVTNPDGSSPALLGWIRQQPEFASVPILVLTDPQHEGDWLPPNDQANVVLVMRERLSDVTKAIHTLKRATEAPPSTSQNPAPPGHSKPATDS
jgi:CheY-like chemotaxis protein